MKNKSMGLYLSYSLIGLLILAAGGVLAKLSREAQGIMLTLPYIMIGIGAGIFGQNLGTVFNILAMKKNPQIQKQKEIEERDERNIAILNKAKAKAYDLMVMVFGALIMAYALIQADLAVILSLIAAYLFIIASYIFFAGKISKEI